jgi:membrane-bound lytic murein transglycosylase A
MKYAAAPALPALLAIVLTSGCSVHEPSRKDYNAPLPRGQDALRRVADPDKLPDLSVGFLYTAGLEQAARNSLNYLGKPSSEEYFPCGRFTHADAVASLKTFLRLLKSDRSPDELARAVRRQFDVYRSVGCDGRGTVLFTAYYTPVFEASLKRTGRFDCPLYKPPANLVKLADGSPATPMPDRRTIETSGCYAGNELVWLADPFEAFVAHVQGSARLRLPSGKGITVGYAANNGHPYKSIRAEMVRDKVIGKTAGLRGMLEYFREHPGKVRTYTRRNPRFIFFRRLADDAPRGCLNEPVIPMRTIATDKRIFPRGCLTFVDTTLPRRLDGVIRPVRYRAFALDQDAGGAIRAPGRCDIYVGAGPEAGAIAGRAKHEGTLYYLFLKRRAE